MRLFVIVALVGCSLPDRELPDAAPTDAVPERRPERQVNRVIAGENAIIWSHGQFVCSLEYGCPTEGPGLTYARPQVDQTWTWIDGGVGARTIVGTESELFLVTGPNYDQMYLRRLGGAGDLNMSIPRPLTVGPAIDATHVYWGDAVEPAGGYTIRRASRTGDGTDVVPVVTSEPAMGMEHLTYAAGHLWWIDTSQSVVRVPIAGGTIERLPVEAATITSIDDVIYVGTARSNGDGTWTEEVGRFASNADYETLAQRQTAGNVPRYIERAGTETFWSVGDGNIYRAPDGEPVSTIDVGDQAGHVFAVLPDRYLVEFNSAGFRSVPR